MGYRVNNAGKEPKGKGNWMFFSDKDREQFDKAFQFNGNYGDAVKAAKKWATDKFNKNTITLYLGG
jgi:hypothetical protein